VPTMSKYPPREDAVAYYLFDCHAEWQGIPGTGTWTYCRGSCPAGEKCLCDAWFGPDRANCDGWDTCWCHS
jgi:hypothetical protein